MHDVLPPKTNNPVQNPAPPAAAAPTQAEIVEDIPVRQFGEPVAQTTQKTPINSISRPLAEAKEQVDKNLDKVLKDVSTNVKAEFEAHAAGFREIIMRAHFLGTVIPAVLAAAVLIYLAIKYYYLAI